MINIAILLYNEPPTRDRTNEKCDKVFINVSIGPFLVFLRFSLRAFGAAAISVSSLVTVDRLWPEPVTMGLTWCKKWAASNPWGTGPAFVQWRPLRPDDFDGPGGERASSVAVIFDMMTKLYEFALQYDYATNPEKNQPDWRASPLGSRVADSSWRPLLAPLCHDVATSAAPDELGAFLEFVLYRLLREICNGQKRYRTLVLCFDRPELVPIHKALTQSNRSRLRDEHPRDRTELRVVSHKGVPELRVHDTKTGEALPCSAKKLMDSRHIRFAFAALLEDVLIHSQIVRKHALLIIESSCCFAAPFFCAPSRVERFCFWNRKLDEDWTKTWIAVGEADLMAPFWLGVLHAQGQPVLVNVCDNDLLPLQLHHVPTLGLDGAAAVFFVVQRDYFWDMNATARWLHEAKIDSQTFIVICALGGTDFTDRASLLPSRLKGGMIPFLMEHVPAWCRVRGCVAPESYAAFVDMLVYLYVAHLRNSKAGAAKLRKLSGQGVTYASLAHGVGGSYLQTPSDLHRLFFGFDWTVQYWSSLHRRYVCPPNGCALYERDLFERHPPPPSAGLRQDEHTDPMLAMQSARGFTTQAEYFTNVVSERVLTSPPGEYPDVR